MQKIPIPQDWEPGGEMQCISIQWPKSKEWERVLAGLLYTAGRGRFWDEDTGSVIEAAAIGDALFDENYPFSYCGGGAGGSDDSGAPQWIGQYFGCDDSECEGCCMSCCITDLRWNAGTLEMLRCGKWEPVLTSSGAAYRAGGVGSGGVILPETGEPGAIVPPELPPGEVENPDCRKAYMVVDAMWRVAAVMWDKMDVIPMLRDWRIVSALPEYTLNYLYIVEATTVLEILKAQEIGEQFEDWFTDDEKQTLVCYLQSLMSDDYGVSALEYNALVVALAAYRGFTLDIENWVWGHFWQVIFEALGDGTVNELAKSAAGLDFAPDCSCPEKPPVGDVTYTTFTATFELDVFSPNTLVVHQAPIVGELPTGIDFVCFYLEAVGGSTGNGEAKMDDVADQVLSSYNTFSRTFGGFASTEGANWLALFKPGLNVYQIDGLNSRLFDVGYVNVKTSGNNVQVTTSVTLHVVYRTADLP